MKERLEGDPSTRRAMPIPALFLHCAYVSSRVHACTRVRVGRPPAGSSFNDYKTGTKPEENKRENDTSKRKRTERRGKVRCGRVNRLERRDQERHEGKD